jgi:hypothetical protein
MLSSGGYHVMLSSEMITHPFFIFPENFTHSSYSHKYAANPPVATVLGSTPASVGTVESEGRQMKQF